MKLRKLKLNMVLFEKKEMKKIIGGGIYKCGCGCGEYNGQTNAADSAQEVYDRN